MYYIIIKLKYIKIIIFFSHVMWNGEFPCWNSHSSLMFSPLCDTGILAVFLRTLRQHVDGRDDAGQTMLRFFVHDFGPGNRNDRNGKMVGIVIES
jgi:hypothetical protein